jgi:hypothetical protein
VRGWQQQPAECSYWSHGSSVQCMFPDGTSHHLNPVKSQSSIIVVLNVNPLHHH